MLGVIVIVSVVVAQDITVSTNDAVLTILPLLFVIVPLTATVYTPAVDGLVHDIASVVGLNAIKVVSCVLSAVFVAV